MRAPALQLAVLVALLVCAGSQKAGAGASCRDRITGCQQMIESKSRSCAEDFCDDCGNQRHRCDATCGFCTGESGASRVAATAAQLAAAASRSHTAIPPVMPAVRSCYTTKLNEPTIRDHRCEGALAGANSCFINMALRLAGCCFAQGTAPPDQRALECRAELDGRICHTRACNTPVPLTTAARPSLALRPGSSSRSSVVDPSAANEITGTYIDPNHPGGYRDVAVNADGSVSVSGSDSSTSDVEWALTGRLIDTTSVRIDFTPKSATIGSVLAHFDGSGLVFPDGNKWLQRDAASISAEPAYAPTNYVTPDEAIDIRAVRDEPRAATNTQDNTGSSSVPQIATKLFFGILIVRFLYMKFLKWRRARNANTMLPMKVAGHRH